MAVTSAYQQYVSGLMSCLEVDRRDGDGVYTQHTTHGYAARSEHAQFFLKEPYDAILLLDADMKHQKDALERLRSHDLDIVVGHYYKRRTSPMESALLEPGEGWPLLPLVDPPREGLHEVGAAGFGIALIKKRVLEDVAKNMPGGDGLFTNGSLPWLTKDSEQFSSDYRFFLMARKIGYKVWLDASVASSHATVVWLGHKTYDKLRDDSAMADYMHHLWSERVKGEGMSLQAFRQRLRILETYRKSWESDAIAKTKAAFEADPSPENKEVLAKASIHLFKLDGKIEEIEQWIELWNKFPHVEYPEQLPVLGTQEKVDDAIRGRVAPNTGIEAEIDRGRQAVYHWESEEFIQELPARGNGGGDNPELRPGGRIAGAVGPSIEGPEKRQPDGGEPQGG